MFLDQDQQASFLFNSNNPEQEQDEHEEVEQEHLQHQLHPPLSLYYFPSPLEDDEVLLFQHHFNHEIPAHDLPPPPPLVMKEAADQNTALPNHDQRTAPTTTTTTTTTSTTPNIKMVDWDVNKRMIGTDQPQIIPRRRSCKRDRHSKINTARGPRDRRMRLSLEVARKFFGLQDILGFDKASKTVEWLLIQSDIEIKKLLKDHDQLISYKYLAMSCDKSTSPVSSESCEVVSGIEEAATNIITINNSTNYGDNDINNGVGKGRGSHGNKASTRRQLSREKAFQPRTKASREKARARARERTEKMNKNKHDQLSRMSTTTTTTTTTTTCWSPFETTGEESAGTQSQNNNNNNMNATCAGHDPNSMEAMARCEVDQGEPRSRSQGGGGGNDQELVTNIQDAFGIMGKWSPPPIFNSMQHQSTSITTTGILQEHHQFADLQFLGKPWEVCNNSTHNLF